MNNTDRAAEIVHRYLWGEFAVGGHEQGEDFCLPLAEALAAGGLLVTDEIQALVDAVAAWKPYDDQVADDNHTVDTVDWDGLAEADDALSAAWTALLAKRDTA